MSTIRANTLQDAAGGNGMTVADLNQGRAKAWVNYNGTGVTSVRDSFNVGSLTDNGVGSWTVNLTTAFPNANYSTGHSYHNEVTGVNTFSNGAYIAPAFINTASSIRQNAVLTQTNAYIDLDVLCVSAFGD